MMLVRLLFAFGLEAWITACVGVLIVIAVLYVREVLRERRGHLS